MGSIAADADGVIVGMRKLRFAVGLLRFVVDVTKSPTESPWSADDGSGRFWARVYNALNCVNQLLNLFHSLAE